ncbi:hypothetical protein SUGI_1065340 [Cryptomeria japonica]|nr:hypothetical protein SUGI_1065340 [Cryptomeria japonica]
MGLTSSGILGYFALMVYSKQIKELIKFLYVEQGLLGTGKTTSILALAMNYWEAVTKRELLNSTLLMTKAYVD